MKKALNVGALVCVLLFVGMFSGGCVALEKARETYQERAREADEAYIAWTGAIDRLNEAQAEFEAFKKDWDALNSRLSDAEKALEDAEASGDAEAIAKAKQDVADASDDLKNLQDRAELVIEGLQTAARDADKYEDAYKATEQLVKSAAKDLKEAESTDDFIGTVLGWLGLGVTTLLTGGGATGVVMARKKKRVEAERDTARSALRTTFGNIENHLTRNELQELKDRQSKTMSDAEKIAARLAKGEG